MKVIDDGIKKREYRHVVDFDLHLEDPAFDFRNLDIN